MIHSAVRDDDTFLKRIYRLVLVSLRCSCGNLPSALCTGEIREGFERILGEFSRCISSKSSESECNRTFEDKERKKKKNLLVFVLYEFNNFVVTNLNLSGG